MTPSSPVHATCLPRPADPDHPAARPLPGSAKLHRLLDAQLNLPAEYAPGLSSHLPMGLQALHALGADEARLQAFFDAYVTHFRTPSPHGRAASPAEAPAVQPGPLDRGWVHHPGWQAALGAVTAFDAWRSLFSQRQHDLGTGGLLAEALPVLWPGLAAAAFHGPIRVAHALAARHGSELGAALAYWAARWQALPPPVAPVAPLPWAEWVAGLRCAAADWQSPAGLISLRMAEAAHSGPYQALASALPPAPLASRLDALGELALAVYGASGDFTWLHAVTGLHALKQLAPHLPGVDGTEAPEGPQAREARTVVERALTAAALAARLRRAGTRPAPAWPAELPDWVSLLAQARVAQDEHSIKLVQAAHAEAAVWGDEGARQAAWMALATLG